MNNFKYITVFTVWFSLFFVTIAFSQNLTEIGIVTAIEGDVSVTNINGTDSVAEGDVVYKGDTFETGESSGVKIILDDESLISLGENTTLELNDYIFTPEKRESISNITKGKIRAILKKIKGSDTNIEFVTPNAVAGIKGTTLFIHVEDNLFAVKEGVVAVNGINGTSQEVILRNNQFTRILDGKPQAPTHMGNQEWLNFFDQTNVSEVQSDNAKLAKKEFPGEEGSDASLSIAELDGSRFYPTIPPIDLTSPVANTVPVTVIVN